MNKNIKIISGGSCSELTKNICRYLGLEETKITSTVFSNDNRFIRIEESVRGSDIYILQTQLPGVDSYLMELLMIIRSAREASASRITAVLPYLPYSRSDKKSGERTCVTARLVADLLQAAGTDRIVVMDMHVPQIQGFFSIPCDEISAAPLLIDYLKTKWDLKNYCLVASDSGAVKKLEPFVNGLNLSVAIIDKRRTKNQGEIIIKNIVGDVKNKKCLLIDDEASSGATLISDAEFLLQKAQAISVDACFVHAALNPAAVSRLNNSSIGRFVTTNTITNGECKLRDCEVVSVASLLAECIKRITQNQSLEGLNKVSI
jgi:ribose-phosphate pyrophosphokinase